MPDISKNFTTITECRSCAARDLEAVLDLGLMPLSDGLVPEGFDRSLEERYPLTLVRCRACSLLQILETVDPKILFNEDYPYFSSFSPALVEHARLNVAGIIERTGVGDDSLVIEIASNDGYLLQWFTQRGIPVLGIDPAPGPAAAALERGIPTLSTFFDLDTAERLVREGQRADVIIGSNVLAHVPDQNEFVAAMAHLLAPGGTIVMEFPYVRDLIDGGEFDTIYHEHACYFSVTTVRDLLARHGLTLVDVEHLDIHGGSLRVFCRRNGEPGASVERYLAEEDAHRLNDSDYYLGFADRARHIRADLNTYLSQLHEDGARVAAYGAAAKGAILLNYCGVGAGQLEFVVDRNTHKHGMEMPGVAIPVVGTEALATDPPDYLLILAWNFAAEIMEQQRAYASGGGRFIIPIPELVVT